MKKWIQAISGISLAARVSLLVAITMWLLAGATWWMYANDPTRLGWGSYMTPQRGAMLVTMWMVCVAAVYASIRVAMNDTPLGHAGVQKAWRTGRALLASRGVRLSDVPCYLALGTEHITHKSANSNGDQNFDDRDTQNDTATLSDCVQWNLQDGGLIASLTGLGRYEPSRQTPSNATVSLVRETRPTSVRENQSADASLKLESAPGESNNQTALIDESSTVPPSSEVEQRVTAVVDQADRMLNHAMGNAPSSSGDHSTNTNDDLNATLHPLPVQSDRSLRRERGLIEFLQRLRRERHPYAAINGILAIIPETTLARRNESTGDRGNHSHAALAGRQLAHDLRLIREILGLDVPVTICIEESFAIPPNRTSETQGVTNSQDNLNWGRHLDPAQRWDAASMSGLADRVVASIVDRIDGQLLSTVLDGHDRPAAIAQNQRYQCFAAQCRQLRSTLPAFLAEAFPLDLANQDSVRLAGVFVDQPDRFNDPSGVMRVLNHQQHELQWTESTHRGQRWQLRINFLLAVTGASLVATACWQWFS